VDIHPAKTVADGPLLGGVIAPEGGVSLLKAMQELGRGW
jgi:hypothetical protein